MVRDDDDTDKGWHDSGFAATFTSASSVGAGVGSRLLRKTGRCDDSMGADFLGLPRCPRSLDTVVQPSTPAGKSRWMADQYAGETARSGMRREGTETEETKMGPATLPPPSEMSGTLA